LGGCFGGARAGAAKKAALRARRDEHQIRDGRQTSATWAAEVAVASPRPAWSVERLVDRPELGEQELCGQTLVELCQRPSLADSEAGGNLAEGHGA
jgi:hypothetical protein